MNQGINEHLTFLYGAETAVSLTTRLEAILNRFQNGHPKWESRNGHYNKRPKSPLRTDRFNERDSILITYGDMVQMPSTTPLAALGDFLKQWLDGVVNTIHFLPFFPYSSDDGFSVVDYWAVNPKLGTWEDVEQVNRHFRLMFDAVINHISAESEWFQQFLQGNPHYQDYFITVEPTVDLSQVFRPRTASLLTAVSTPTGTQHVWTTFSPDQIDLNFSNPDVLFKILELLLFYISHGAEFIRLDAIGFMWKEIGTNCLHLPQAHRAIQLMRTALNKVAPHVALITETNVPHADNISYFGDGHNEAQLVYNFSLPPLTLHAFHTGNAETLSRWAETLTLPSDEVTFFNFLASHDGIGLTPVRGILDETAVSNIANRVKALGGHVSYKNNPDGSKSPYELNINYLDALGDPAVANESTELITRRFLASQAIMLALRGVPGIYFHSLFGSRNWHEGVAQTGRARTINREKLRRETLEAELADPTGLRHQLFSGYRRLLTCRTQEPAFHPNGAQEIIDCHPSIFGLWREAINENFRILCLHNVSNQAVSVSISVNVAQFRELITDEVVVVGNSPHSSEGASCLQLTLAPYQIMWLKEINN